MCSLSRLPDTCILASVRTADAVKKVDTIANHMHSSALGRSWALSSMVSAPVIGRLRMRYLEVVARRCWGQKVHHRQSS